LGQTQGKTEMNLTQYEAQINKMDYSQRLNMDDEVEILDAAGEDDPVKDDYDQRNFDDIKSIDSNMPGVQHREYEN